MKKNKLNFTIHIITVFIIIISCNQSGNSSSNVFLEKKIKIGISMDDLIQERWVRDKDLLLKHAKKSGAEAYVEIAGGDEKKQIEQIKNLISKDIDVLIVIPVNSLDGNEIVRLAHESDITVISYDRLMRNCDLDYFISYNSKKVGKIQAEYMIKSRSKGKYALIGGSNTDSNSLLIKLGQMNVLQPYVEKGDIEIVFDEFAEAWLDVEGLRLMEEALDAANDSVDVVLAANDDLAKGAIVALELRGLSDKVLISGQDADLSACQNIVQGSQTITIYKPIDNLAASAIDLAIKVTTNKKISIVETTNNGEKLVPSILLSPVLVTSETLQMTVIQDGYWTEEQIYQKNE